MEGLTNWWIFIKEGREKVKISNFLFYICISIVTFLKKAEIMFKERMDDVVQGTILYYLGHGRSLRERVGSALSSLINDSLSSVIPPFIFLRFFK